MSNCLGLNELTSEVPCLLLRWLALCWLCSWDCVGDNVFWDNVLETMCWRQWAVTAGGLLLHYCSHCAVAIGERWCFLYLGKLGCCSSSPWCQNITASLANRISSMCDVIADTSFRQAVAPKQPKLQPKTCISHMASHNLGNFGTSPLKVLVV